MQTSRVQVSELEKSKPKQIQEEDIEIQTFKSSGPGGQRRDKKETAVRATYKPTSETIVVSRGRNQHSNKQKARFLLEEKLKEKIS